MLVACADATPAFPRDLGPGAAGLDASAGTAEAGPSSARSPDACNQLVLEFAPRTPRVVILVDRSSSMFERGLWGPLRDGVLAVVEQLQHDVLFGFVSYTGQAGGTCPDLSEVPTARDNYASIARTYGALAPPSYKGETPTSLAIERVASGLGEQPGNDYILLVTDGEPDLCDDGNVTCARDRSLASVQRARARGIGSLVFSVGGSVDRTHLQDLANAGMGEPVSDHGDAVKYQCQGEASYGDADGKAPYYEPSLSDREALTAVIASALTRTRSCLFDLTGRVEVQPGQEQRGMIVLNGVPVHHGDGYRMVTGSQLELLGESCQQLRSAEAASLSIAFPCEALILY